MSGSDNYDYEKADPRDATVSEALYEDEFVASGTNDIGYSASFQLEAPEVLEELEDDETILLTNPLPRVDSDQFRVSRWGSKKKQILAVVSLCAFVAPFANPLFLPGLDAIAKEFNASDTAIALASSIYTLPLGVMPLFWGPASDTWGRRRFFLLNFSLMIIIFYFASFSWSIYAVILFRFLEALPISSMQVLAYGVISDVFPRRERGNATGIMSACPMLGPLIGPVLGGFLAQFASWRLSFTLVAVVATVDLLLFLYVVEETLDKSSGKKSSRANPIRPFKLLFTTPRLMAVGTMMSISLGQTLLMNFIISTAVQTAFSLSGSQVGLMMVPVGIGNVVASFVGGRMADWGRKRKGTGGRLMYTLVVSTAACVIFPIFGFLCQISWVSVVVLTFLAGFCRTSGSPGAMTYCIEQNPRSPGTVTAGISAYMFMWVFLVQFLAPVVYSAIDSSLGYGYIYLGLSALQLAAASIVAFFMFRDFKDPESRAQDS